MTHDCTIIFEVPSEVAEVAAAIENAYGLIEEGPEGQAPSEFLPSMVGQLVEVRFEDDNDPAGTLVDVAAALERVGARYVGVSSSYTERSRGERIRAQFHYNTEGSPEGRRQAFFPWHEGEPSLDPRSLEIAGVPEDEIAGIELLLRPLGGFQP